MSYLNHSSKPNCYAVCEMHKVNEIYELHITIKTNKDIIKGEELTIDYGEDYWKNTKFKDKTYYAYELSKLKDNKKPVHAFYVDSRAETNFREIAKETGKKPEYIAKLIREKMLEP